MALEGLGKLLLMIEGFIVLLGLLLLLAGRAPFLGKLPGDILVQRGDFAFYFPIVTFLILSLVLTLLLNLILRLLR